MRPAPDDSGGVRRKNCSITNLGRRVSRPVTKPVDWGVTETETVAEEAEVETETATVAGSGGSFFTAAEKARSEFVHTLQRGRFG